MAKLARYEIDVLIKVSGLPPPPSSGDSEPICLFSTGTLRGEEEDKLTSRHMFPGCEVKEAVSLLITPGRHSQSLSVTCGVWERERELASLSSPPPANLQQDSVVALSPEMLVLRLLPTMFI